MVRIRQDRTRLSQAVQAEPHADMMRVLSDMQITSHSDICILLNRFFFTNQLVM